MNDRKRILIFSLTYLPFVGGAEIAIKEITNRLGNVYRFDLITLRVDPNLPRRERIGNVTVHRIGPAQKGGTLNALFTFPWYLVKVLYVPLATLHAVRLHKKHTFDLIWGMMTNMGFPAVIFKLLYSHIPFVLTLQDGDTKEHITSRLRIRIVYPLFKLIFKKVDHVQVISKYLGTLAREFGYRGEISVIPNGVPIKQFENVATESIHRVRRRHKLDEGVTYLFTASRLVPKNGTDVTIQALAKLPPTIHFIIAGAGPEEESLRQIASDLHLSSRVHFLGYIDQDDIPAYLHVADIFVRPSRSEGQGIAFIEAMAAGTPVIATPVGGIVDFIEHKHTGRLCSVDDPMELAQQVKAYITDDVSRRRIIKNAQSLVRSEYDWDDVVDQMRSRVFHKLLQ